MSIEQWEAPPPSSPTSRELPWIKALITLAAFVLVGAITMRLADADPTVVASSLAALAGVLGGIAALLRALRGRR